MEKNKKQPTCIRITRIYFKTLKQLIFLPVRKIKKLRNKDFSNKTSCFSESIKSCSGCGCFLCLLYFLGCVVVWAWHIHWAFGVLILLFILGIR